jgi:putative SOS response-associated peptidase YedK
VLPGVDGPALVPMRWGLIPSWWKKTAKDVPSTFNARAESVADKMFRSALPVHHPGIGLLRMEKDARRQAAVFVSAVDGGVLSIALLWGRGHSTDNGETGLSCTARTPTSCGSQPNAGPSGSPAHRGMG